jgi:site-specific recombinase XerD
MEETNVPTFITDFSNYLIAIKNFSAIYVKNMAITIQQFLYFINIHKFNEKYDSINKMSLNDLRSLTNSDIYSFMFFLAENHYKTSSRITKTEHLRAFFDYLFRIQHTIFKEPFKQIKREKKKYLQLPNYLSLEESKKLLKQYAESTNKTEIRNNAILHLLLNCGLRVSEIKNLNISDINLNNDTFIINGKGNKERTGYLNQITKNALLKYLEIRKDMKTKHSKDKDALFLVRGGTRISTRRIEKMVDIAYEDAGIDNKVYTVHTLRHTCATLLYRNGIDIKVIKELLGHVRIDTTEIYTHLYDKEVMDAMFSHPLAKFKMANAMAYCT